MSIYDGPAILAFFCVFAAILGAVLGSFLNCAAWRIAHNESFISGRSRCPTCGHDLGVPDLVPILSWCFLRGKCRYCGSKVSIRYPLTELFFALVTVACLLRGDLTVLTLRNLVFLCCLFCLSLVDLDAYIIPDGCIVIALFAWLAALPFSGMSWKEIGLHVLAGIVTGGAILLLSLLMDRILHKDTRGGGDIKLFTVMLACIFGLLFSVVLRLLPGEREAQIPFGPSISASVAVVLLFGGPVINWYLHLLGAG